MENILEPEKNHLIAAHLFPVDQQTDSWTKRCSPVNINIYYVYFIKTLIIELMLTLMITCDFMTTPNKWLHDALDRKSVV